MLCLLTHDRSARCTLLTPLLNGDAAILEADDEATLTLGPFSYRLARLFSTNVSQRSGEYDAEAAELYAQADFMLTDTHLGVLTLYRFHESTLQVSACMSMSADDLAQMRRGGVFVRLYAPGAGDSSQARIALAFPQGTQVQELAKASQEDALAQAGPSFAALTPGPEGCEVHYTSSEAPFARAWLPGPTARVDPSAVAGSTEDLPCSG